MHLKKKKIIPSEIAWRTIFQFVFMYKKLLFSFHFLYKVTCLVLYFTCFRNKHFPFYFYFFWLFLFFRIKRDEFDLNYGRPQKEARLKIIRVPRLVHDSWPIREVREHAKYDSILLHKIFFKSHYIFFYDIKHYFNQIHYNLYLKDIRWKV